MKLKADTKKFSKFLAYVMGRCPEEFGLVPDQKGFVKIKELLKALHEEEGWRHIRRSHLTEVLLTMPRPSIEIREDRIRAVERSHLTFQTDSDNPPKLLYTCIRSRAYSFALQKGVFPSHHASIILSSDPEMAKRIGRRFDPTPVMLVVQVQQATKAGVVFQSFRRIVFLADHLPPGVFSGPPLPKEKIPSKKESKGVSTTRPTPGGFVLEIDSKLPPKPSRPMGSPDKSEASRRMKKPKRKRERPPWRR